MKVLVLLAIMLLSTGVKAQDRQVAITLRNGTIIKGNLIGIDPANSVTLSIAGVETTMNMSEIAKIDAIQDNNQVQPVITTSDIDNYRGFLLEKGNNVYVYYDNEQYGKRGAEKLKTLLKANGFWNVVDRMEDAHFTLNYGLKLSGRDQVLLSVSSWKTNNLVYLYVKRKWGVGRESNHDIFALELYNDVILPFQKKIAEGKVSKVIKKKFTL